jgi:hypothetical protein
MESTNRHPLVTLLAVLAFTLGGLAALAALSILTGASYLSMAGNDTGGLSLYGLTLLTMSLADLALGYGAWNLKHWAWPLGIIIEAAALALALLFIVLGSEPTRQLITVVPAAGMLAILLSPGVRQAFGRD